MTHKIDIVVRGIVSEPYQVTKTTGFTGYHVIASFIMRTDNGLLNSALKAELTDEGVGTFYFPSKREIVNDLIHFEFYGPGGYWVADRVTKNESAVLITDKDQQPIPFEVELIKEKELNQQQYVINGRLIDIRGKEKIARRNLFIISADNEDVSNEKYQILHALTTDLEGYFSFELPVPHENREVANARVKFATADLDPEVHYFAVIPSSEERIFPLRKSDKLLEDRQIIGITPTAVENAEAENPDDCQCDNTPRLPSASDFGSLEGVFSQDLGVGCVEFTKANRVVEEHQFIQIVRTTDPQITKVNLNTSTFLEILQQMERDVTKPPYLILPPLSLTGLKFLSSINHNVTATANAIVNIYTEANSGNDNATGATNPGI